MASLMPCWLGRRKLVFWRGWAGWLATGVAWCCGMAVGWAVVFRSVTWRLRRGADVASGSRWISSLRSFASLRTSFGITTSGVESSCSLRMDNPWLPPQLCRSMVKRRRVATKRWPCWVGSCAKRCCALGCFVKLIFVIFCWDWANLLNNGKLAQRGPERQRR